MFECIKSCSTAPEQVTDPLTDIDAHRWRRLLPQGKQRRAGPAWELSEVRMCLTIHTGAVDGKNLRKCQ